MKLTFSTIRSRLLIIILSLLVVSLGFVAGLSYYFSKQYLTRSVDETAFAIGSDYANRIQAIEGEMLVRLQEISTTQRFRSGTDKEFIVFTMNEAFKRIGKFDVMTFISMDGTGTRSDGSTINLSSRQFFKDAVSTQKPLISEPVVAAATGKLSVQVVTPVFDNGKMTGVMTGTVSLANLSNMIAEVKFKDSGYGVICDESGVIIANGKNPELVGNLNIKDKKINPKLKQGNAKLDERLVMLFKQAAETGKQTRGVYTFIDGVDYVAVLTPINLPGEHRWVMMVTAPEAEATQETRTLTQIMLIVSLVCIVFGVLVIVYISKKFAQPIIIIRDEALLLAKGDLRTRDIDVRSNDETGQLINAFKEMVENLRTLIGKVQSQADSVAASSEELTASAQQSADVVNQVAGSIVQISKGADHQADAVNSMATVVEMMSASIEQIAASGKLVAEIANSTSKETVEGRQAIDQAMTQMKQIGEGSAAVQKAIGELVKGSNEISEIVNLIASIAGQTNLLALNAAIEAARAGEHGRGFAVVADEVRKLAEDSNQAAQKIANLIKKNQTDMNEAIATTQANNNGVNNGVSVVKLAGDTFKKIADSVVQLSRKVSEISDAIDQIAVGSQALVESVQEIDIVSKKNAEESHLVSVATEEQAASMQEIASASQGLAQISYELQEEIVKFKV